MFESTLCYAAEFDLLHFILYFIFFFHLKVDISIKMACKFAFLRFLSISFSNKSYFDGSVYESTDCQNLINKTFVGPHKLDIEHWRRGWFAWMPGPSSVRSCKAI